MDFGWIFIDFLPQHGMAEIAKIVDSSTFFIDFWYFGSWALGLILGLIFDGFLGDLGVDVDGFVGDLGIDVDGFF